MQGLVTGVHQRVVALAELHRGDDLAEGQALVFFRVEAGFQAGVCRVQLEVREQVSRQFFGGLLAIADHQVQRLVFIFVKQLCLHRFLLPLIVRGC